MYLIVNKCLKEYEVFHKSKLLLIIGFQGHYSNKKNIGHYKWNEYITEKVWSYLQSSASFSILLYHRCIIILLVQIVHQKNSYVFILFYFFSKILEKRTPTLNLYKKKKKTK